jgi:hypothetical protein
MMQDMRQRLLRRPFEPFVMSPATRSVYRVPTAEHAGINPQGNRAVVWFDDGSGVDISALHALHITALKKEAPPPS